jgi:hypothetical protein
MAESMPQAVALPKKPCIGSESVDESVPLMLVISDRDSVSELLQKTEGRERDEYALTALRIGLLALKHARGQIDADAVKREGEKLLGDLKHALNQSCGEIHTSLTTALREYFDPSGGRFQERVDRLIKEDGELEQVLRRQVGASGSELAATLATHIGENSPLMKMLNPEESDGLVSSMTSAISEVVGTERDRILGEFSLDNERSALRRLVKELTDEGGKLQKGLAEEVGHVVREFSLDNEDSALSRLVKRVEMAEATITKEFSLDQDGSALSRLSGVINGAKAAIDENLTLDNDDSALSRLRRELLEVLERHQEKVESFQAGVQSALEALKARREEADRSTTHGKHFEDAVAEFVEREAQKSSDIAARTGTTAGAIRSCKVGDLVVELGADCAAAGARFVVEAKEHASYTLAKAREELQTAKRNRKASVGLFVFSRRAQPEGMNLLLRDGDDVFIVWDAERVEADVILRAGLSLAKALCLRQTRARQAEHGSWKNIDAAITALQNEAKRLVDMKTWSETIQSSGAKILAQIHRMHQGLDEQLLILAEEVNALKEK